VLKIKTQTEGLRIRKEETKIRGSARFWHAFDRMHVGNHLNPFCYSEEPERRVASLATKAWPLLLLVLAIQPRAVVAHPQGYVQSLRHRHRMATLGRNGVPSYSYCGRFCRAIARDLGIRRPPYSRRGPHHPVELLIAKSKVSEGLPGRLKGSAKAGGDMSSSGASSFQELDAYLSSLGIDNRGERARLIDLNTNPRSLFATGKDRKRSVSAQINARPLSIEKDIDPVINLLISEGVEKDALASILTSHPAILGYRVEAHLAPIINYLKQIGVPNVGELIQRRPSLLGLTVDNNLERIVDYLKSMDTPIEKIIDYLGTSI